MTAFDALWADLPGLVRAYPTEKRNDAREQAYGYFQRFAKVQDVESLGKLRFVLQSKADIVSAFKRGEWA